MSVTPRIICVLTSCSILGCGLVLPTKNVAIEIITLPPRLKLLPVEEVLVMIPHTIIVAQPGDTITLRIPRNQVTLVVALYRIAGHSDVETVAGGIAIPGRPAFLSWDVG